VASRIIAERVRRVGYEVQRGEILEAAAKAIAEHGFHGMSMRGLALATGRGLASFYNYFSSKEDLLFSLQAEAFETMTKSAKAALVDVHEHVDQLYVFVLNHLRFSVDHRSVMRVLVHEASALPAGKRKTVRLLKEGYFNLCKDIVAFILTDGCNSPGAGGAASLDPIEVERVTYSVFGMLNWSYGWYDPKQHGTPEDVAKTIHALAVCGLVARCPHRFAQGNLQRYLSATAPPPLIGSPCRSEATSKQRLLPSEKVNSRRNVRKTL
jgi:AcrR family transcriptional regulator